MAINDWKRGYEKISENEHPTASRNPSKLTTMENLKVASFFCGCGGADLGTLGGFEYLGRRYARLPFDVAYAADIDKWAVRTYNENFAHKAVCADVTEVDFATLPDVDVLVAGFPCQSFSMVNQNGRTDGDDRAALYRQVVRFLHEKRPKAFVCENVRGLVTMKGGAVIRRIADEFTDCGYNVQWRLMDAADYGIPQFRKRVIIVGIRKDLDCRFEYPEPTTADCHIPARRIITTLDGVDRRWFFSERVVQGVMKYREKGGPWNRGIPQNLDEPSRTIASGLLRSGFASSNPSVLVDAATNTYRRYTDREAAAFQSFPEDFKWPCAVTHTFHQIGNAVAPVFFWHVMAKLAEALEGVR